MLQRQGLIIAFAAIVLAMSGCSGDADMNMTVRLADPIRVEGPMMVFEGQYISDELFKRLKENETTEDWVLALLGEPTSRYTLNDGTSVWKWVYREQGFNTSVFKLTGSDEEPTLPQLLTFVRLRDGVVIEKWRG